MTVGATIMTAFRQIELLFFPPMPRFRNTAPTDSSRASKITRIGERKFYTTKTLDVFFGLLVSLLKSYA